MKPCNSSTSWVFRERGARRPVEANRPRLATRQSAAYHGAFQNEVSAMIIHDSHRGAGFLLTDSARLLRKLIDRRLQPLGLSRAQWSVLAILANHEGVSQSQISQELEIEKSTAGRLIDQVEKSGWIERRPIPGDRRLWSIHLTDQARQLLVEIERVILHAREEMLRGLSEEQQNTLTDLLRTLKANLSDALELNGNAAGGDTPAS